MLAGAAIAIGLLAAAPQDQSGVYRVGGNVSAPRVISRTDPAYTDEASAAKVEGTVLLSVVIGTDGVAHDINVVKGVGSGLDEKAVEAVQKWHFAPGTKDGEAVKVKAQIEVNFRMK
jgi:TonB family protein